jgi:hypothetical protein
MRKIPQTNAIIAAFPQTLGSGGIISFLYLFCYKFTLPIQGLSIPEKKGERVNMRAIVDAYEKDRQMIAVLCGCGAKIRRFRFRITGIDIARKKFLTDIVDFHGASAVSALLISSNGSIFSFFDPVGNGMVIHSAFVPQQPPACRTTAGPPGNHRLPGSARSGFQSPSFAVPAPDNPC